MNNTNSNESLKNKLHSLISRLSKSLSRNKPSFLYGLYYRIKPYFFCSEVSVRFENVSYKIDLPEDGYADLIREEGMHEPGLTIPLSKEFDEKTVFWNVGAHCGYFTLLANECMDKPENIHSFEPYYVFHILKYNSKKHAPGVVNVNAGLSNQAGSEPFKLISGDAYAESQQQAPTLIKMDIEGHELLALQGLKKILTSHKPVLYCEIHPSLIKSQGGTLEELLDYLEQLGYAISYIDRFRHSDYTIESDFKRSELPEFPFLITAR